MRIKSLILIMSPILITSLVLGSVYVLKRNDNNEYDANEGDISVDDDDNDKSVSSRFDPTIKYKKSDIFPKLRIQDLYEFIEVTKDGPILTQEIVARIIKIVVSGLGVTFGELKFEWQFTTQQQLIMKVFWYERKLDIEEGFDFLLSMNYYIQIINN